VEGAISDHRPETVGAARRPGRRNNAPIRPPRRRATSVPDLLFALATAAWAMAIVFVVASYLDDKVTSGDAGPVLARIFAGALAISGLFIALLGYGLLRDESRNLDHYAFPAFLGLVVGGLEAAIFLWPADQLLLGPFALLILVFRPVRRGVARLLHLPRARTA